MRGEREELTVESGEWRVESATNAKHIQSLSITYFERRMSVG